MNRLPISPSLSRALSLIFAVLLLAATVAWGSVARGRAFLARGIPQELPEPTVGAGLKLGVNVDLPADEAALAALLDQLSAAHLRQIKATFYYDDEFDWALVERQLAQLEAAGLTLTPLLDGDPTNQFAPPADPEQFAAWAGAFASRFGAQIDHYIIWDEPNLTTHWGDRPVNPDEYTALLNAASHAIRAADATALIVAAPLAPTVETGPQNLAPQLYLQRLYEADAASAFDIVAGKPYGFDSPPTDRTVDPDMLNFSHIILLRETMVANGDAGKAIWAGNWGWNSLPADWQGPPSIWGQVDAVKRAEWTVAALQRVRAEWPWMGQMYLEHWRPAVAADSDPRIGFTIYQTRLAQALNTWLLSTPAVAYPGFHLAAADASGQDYNGGWRFESSTGADISASGDAVTFTFYGTDIGLRVRRADFRARFHVWVDGQPAPALPRDESGAALVLTAPDPSEDYITTVVVAAGLEPGVHTVRLVADRGWEQWALRGFAVGYRPVASQPGPADWGLGLLALFSVVGLVVTIPRASWPGWLAARSRWFRRLSSRLQLLLTALLGASAALAGWFTWGQQAAGLYRRAGDLGQLTLTATAAAVFYVAPSFYLYVAALLLLFLLLYLRPAWGLVLVAFSLPLYVLPKAMLGYRFSPVEFFILLTFIAALAHWSTIPAARHQLRWRRSDGAALAFLAVATASLWFTARLDVATNEWRVVIVEPLLIYASFRLIRPDERERAYILDGLVASGLMIALIGLGQYLTGQNLITAEGGLLRLRSIYGSPNNVALYFDRILPFTLAFALAGGGWRRWAYGAATLLLGLAGLLTFSKGGLLLGFPVAVGVVLLLWLKGRGRRVWPWLLAVLVVGPAGLLVVQQIPALSGRLDILGVTSDFRINLWRASLNMIRENPWWGVGLDNFLYAYRGRYILQAAWQEPNLNHPHNIILDYWTRLGIFGLLSGLWLWAELAGSAWRRWRATPAHPFALGLAGAVAAMLAHGLVDQSYFLVDLAGAFCLLLGLASSENRA